MAQRHNMGWNSCEVDTLLALVERRLKTAEISTITHRSERSIHGKLYRLRKQGRAFPSSIARARMLTPEQRELMALYRRKELPAAEAWAAVERMA